MKVSNYLKTSSGSFSRAQSASFLISTLNSFQGVLKVSSFSGHDLNFVKILASTNFKLAEPLQGHESDLGLGALHDHFCPMVLGMVIPRSPAPNPSQHHSIIQ